jgi:hypothetical protein
MLERRRRAVKKLLMGRREVVAFAGVGDRRRPHGRRWALAPILAAIVLGIMAKARSVREVEDKTDDMGSLRSRFGIRRRVPRSTIGRVAAHGVAPSELQAHLGRTIRAEQRRKTLAPTELPVGCVALDGKGIRAVHREAVNADCQEVHPQEGAVYYKYLVFRAVLTSAGPKLCIGQQTVPGTTNEMGCFAKFFGWLMEWFGRSGLFEVVFTDAGSTSKDNAALVDAANKGYVLGLKENQPELLREAKRLLLPQMRGQPPEAETAEWEKDHRGRWLKRQMWRTFEIAGYLDWPHLQQAIVVRTLQRLGDPKHGPCKTEVVEDRYFVSNLAVGHRLKGMHMLRAIRQYWQVEEHNRVMDVELEEDELPFTQVGDGVPVTTLLRVLAANLLALLRDVHLRSAENRQLPWRRVRDLVWQTLVIGEVGEDDSNDGEPAAAT